MPVKFRCTECGKLIAVPSKLVGKTINCPHNGCLVEVRAELVESSQILHVGNGKHSHPSLPVKLDEPQNGETPHDGPPAKSPNWLRRNVARFIPGGGFSSTTLASDGRLPELKLQEGQARRAAGEGEGTNPLVMIGVLCLSFVMSTALVMIDFDSAPSGAARQAQARKRLADFYQTSKGPLEPYQQYLRDAQRAHARGDDATERQMYQKVLQLLRSEGKGRFTTLTHTQKGDKDLEELLAVLMAQQ